MSQFWGSVFAFKCGKHALDQIGQCIALNGKATDSDLAGLPISGTPENVGKTIVADTEKRAKVVAASGATAD